MRWSSPTQPARSASGTAQPSGSSAGPLRKPLGASLDLIIPERQRTRHWDGYRSVMATGTTKYGSDLLRVPSLHSDGQRRSIAFTVTLLEDAEGAVTGIAAVVRDETERWNEEQELRRLAHRSAD